MSDVLVVCGGFVFLWIYSALMYYAGWCAAEVRAETQMSCHCYRVREVYDSRLGWGGVIEMPKRHADSCPFGRTHSDHQEGSG